MLPSGCAILPTTFLLSRFIASGAIDEQLMQIDAGQKFSNPIPYSHDSLTWSTDIDNGATSVHCCHACGDIVASHLCAERYNDHDWKL
jgi:hypothetical protein